MTPLLFIRKKVFKVSQAEMADLAGVSQATVSRWEAGILKPGLAPSINIREAATQRGIAWDDNWFFRTPTARAVRQAPPENGEAA